MKQLDAQNILAFLERVSVTGPREAGEFLRCCQLLVEIAQKPDEQQQSEKPALSVVPSPPAS